MLRCFSWRACCALVGLAICLTARAANDVWDANGANPPFGVWSINSNWVDNTTPGNGDTATFNLGDAYVVTITPDPPAIQALTVSAGDVTFASSGAVRTISVNSASGGQDVSVTGGASLTLGTSAFSAVNLVAGDDLSVAANSVLTAGFGSDVTAADLSSGGLNGTINIDGSGSTLTLTGTGLKTVGSSADGVLSFANGSTGNSISGALGLAISLTAGASATMSITGGSSVTLGGNLSMANQNAATSATLDISGAGSLLTQSGASTITVGAANSSVGAINIGTTSDGGTLTTGSGTLTINATGSVSIGNGTNNGTLNANGNVIINGGTLTRDLSPSAFNLATGGTFTIQNGGEASFSGNYTATDGATYLVTGAGSNWTNAGDIAFGNFGDGTLLIQNGGNVSSSNGIIGRESSSVGMATVAGAGSNWVTAGLFGGDLIVGHLGQGTLLIEQGGSASSTTGILGAEVGSQGNVTVSGTGSSWAQLGGDLIIGKNGSGTLSIEAGANVHSQLSDGIIGDAPGSMGSATVTGLDSNWSNVLFFVGNQGSGTLLIEQGGSVDCVRGYIADKFGSTGSVTVSDIGSVWTISDKLLIGDGGAGVLSIESGGTVFSDEGESTGTVTIVGPGSSWTNANELDLRSGVLSIEAGGAVSNSDASVGRALFGSGTANVIVTAAGSTWNSSGTVYLGGSELGPAASGILTVETGGTVNIGQDLVLWEDGTVNLNGGQINLAALVLDTANHDGTVDFNAGTLNFTTSQSVAADGPIALALGGQLQLVDGQHLSIDGTATLEALLSIAGGGLLVDSLAVSSALGFTAGLLEVRGGPITGLTQLVVPANGEFRVSGAHLLSVSGSAGSTITAIGNLVLGNLGSPNGFGTAGTVNVGTHAVTLLDANDAVFDSLALVTLGDGGSPGTLAAANGLTLDFGGNIAGFGSVQTPNDAAKPLINNGHIAGNSAPQPITLTGYVKGVGTFNNVTFMGTFDPGFSPALTMVGSITFGATNTLIMELGGTDRGDEYDAILASGTLGLGGTLQVTLTGGFDPALGDSFDLFDWASLAGAFNTLQLPALNSDLMWNPTQLYTAGVLSVALAGDYNFDGTVDTADYVVWRKNDGSQEGYDIWRTHFGQTAGSGSGNSASQTSVPEPVSFALFGVAVALLATARWRR